MPNVRLIDGVVPAGGVRWRSLAVLMLALSAPLDLANAQQADATDVQAVHSTPVADGFTFAAVGDFIYLRPMLPTIERQSPDMLAILRDADVTFANFETSAFHMSTFKGSPQAESGGTWMLADPRVAADAAGMGIDMVSHANNHSTDWGVEGLFETLTHLEEAGLVYSGTGRTLSAARAPAYFDGPTGRIGLVSASSSFTPMSRAADPVGDVPGRGGVNHLRTEKVGLVSPSDLAVLARLAGSDPGSSVRFNNMRYEAMEAPGADSEAGMVTRFDVNAADTRANLLSVRQAKANGNFVAYSLHNHEPGNQSQEPADFAVEFAHQVIDAGADIFIGHGPHQLRGIEIYHGKPIFYSLGNFAMMNNSLDVIPADMYEQFGVAPGDATVPELLQQRNARSFNDPVLYESVIAVTSYAHGVADEIRLYPIDLGVSASGAARGVPKMADSEAACRILERLQRLSAPFGTTLTIEGPIGIIRLPGAN